MSKKLRRMFVEKGYQTNLINEYRTSITCNECGGELAKFLYKEKKRKMSNEVNERVGIQEKTIEFHIIDLIMDL